MTRAAPTTWARRLFVGYAVVLALILLNPSAQLPSDGVGLVERLLLDLGLGSDLVQGYRVEFVLNVAALVPISLLGSLIWPHRNWRDWTAAGFVFSMGVEAVQALLLVERSATYVDVVANTAGAMIGALAVAAWRASRVR